MDYCFQLLPHANIRYQEALDRLGAAELACLMHALGLPVPAFRQETIGGASFLTFQCPELTPEQLRALGQHSAMLMLLRREGPYLLPLEAAPRRYLPRDLAEVLKYKGKTNAVFTHMMLNLALAASDFFAAPGPLTVLDPLCGRGTSCFVALQQGMNAVGIDVDRRDLKEAADHMSRYLQFHKLKHTLKQSARTVGRTNIPEALYTLADTKERYQAGDTRSLRLLLGDTGLAGELLRKTPVNIILADLPYGIQHAPQEGQRPESFAALMQRALPAWRQALKPGGAMALSFNSLTLPRKRLAALVEAAGFQVLEAPFANLEHFVEQAVTRDVVIARKPSAGC